MSRYKLLKTILINSVKLVHSTPDNSNLQGK